MQANGALAPGTPPEARFISAGQRFDLTLLLSLPDSAVNADVGVFQVVAELRTAGGKLAAAASRPVMLRHRRRGLPCPLPPKPQTLKPKP